MHCPFCGHGDSQVVDSRLSDPATPSAGAACAAPASAASPPTSATTRDRSTSASATGRARAVRPREAAGRARAGGDQAAGRARAARGARGPDRRRAARRGRHSRRRAGGRAGAARTARARPRRLRALRLRVPEVRGRRGVRGASWSGSSAEPPLQHEHLFEPSRERRAAKACPSEPGVRLRSYPLSRETARRKALSRVDRGKFARVGGVVRWPESETGSARPTASTRPMHGLAIERRFTAPGVHPFDELEWEVRDARHRRSRPSPPSSSATSSSRRAGRRTRPTSSRRSTSAASSARRSASTPSSRWSAASPARSPAGAARAATSRPPHDADAFEAELTPHPGQPAGGVQLAGLVQRRLRGEPAVLGVLHPLRRRHDGVDPRLEHQGGHDLPRRLRLGHQPLEDPLLQGAALEGRPRLRARVVHARRRRVGRHDQVRRQDAARGQDGRARRRPPRHPRLHLVQGARRRTRPRRCAEAGFDMSIDGEGFHSIQYQNANNSVRVTDEFLDAVENGEEWQTIARVSRRADRHAQRPRPDERDRRGGVALRRPGRPVRHDDQRLAHVPEHGPDQRVQPVLRIHARRRLGLQPRLDQPAQVPARRRHLRHRRRSSTRSTSCSSRRRSSSASRATRPRRSAATRARCASSASATRTSARC